MVVIYLVMQRRQEPAYRPTGGARPVKDADIDTAGLIKGATEGIGWLINTIKGIGEDETAAYRYGGDQDRLSGGKGVPLDNYLRQDDTGAKLLEGSDGLPYDYA